MVLYAYRLIYFISLSTVQAFRHIFRHGFRSGFVFSVYGLVSRPCHQILILPLPTLCMVMSSADFFRLVKENCSSFSGSETNLYPPHLRKISRGKTHHLPGVNTVFIKHTQITDGELSSHVLTGPGCTTPQIRFLFAIPNLRMSFLQAPPHGNALALFLSCGLILEPRRGTYTLHVMVCPATHGQAHQRQCSTAKLTSGAVSFRGFIYGQG